jgi:hypothetical protein
MIVPDITGPKTLPPTILFVIFASGIVDFGLANNALFIVLALTIIYRFFMRITYKPADVLMPAVLYVLLKPGKLFLMNTGENVNDPTVLLTHTIGYSLMFALLRLYFPSYY